MLCYSGMCTRPSEPIPDTETRPETHVSETETSQRRDVAASKTLAETLKLPRLLRVSGASKSRRDVFCDVW